MKPTEQICDTSRIEDYLQERLSDSSRMEFEDHLSVCDRCQTEIQRRAAEPSMWRDARELLGDPDGESSLHALNRTYDEPKGDDREKRHALSVLDSLTPTDDPEMLGRVGDYEVSGVVGVGGMGAVLKGFDKSLRRVVAIKVMAPHLANSGSARTRFQREARAAAAITHDNVIDTYGVSEANGLPYLVMPYARGPSLQKRIDESGPLSALEVVRIGRQIAGGLSAAHEQGLVHRDIKPANILLNEGIERLWITDFGVARAVDDASMTQTGVIAGTPQYMSPEQARGEAVDHRSDLFSLGSVLYTACTGRPPFRSEAAYGILRRITDTDPRPIREINPEIPDWLCRVIERLMAKHPDDRYQSAGEVADLLEACLAHLQQPTRMELPACVRRAERSETAARQRGEPKETTAREQAARPQASPLQRAAGRLLFAGLLLVGAFFLGRQLTEPTDIAGPWTGEKWKDVSLSAVAGASGWYNGSFTTPDGRRGALRLEWSRLQRRYNGRWKVGDNQAGSLTLRVRGREARGAVAFDPDASAAPNSPRLRDFTWRRGSGGGGRKSGGSRYSIEAPIRGRLVRWGSGIREDARVEKGGLIAELEGADPAYRKRLDEQQAAAVRHVDVAKRLVRASENNLESAKTIVAALEDQYDAYRQLKQEVVAAATATVQSAQKKVEALKSEVAAMNAALAQGMAEVDRLTQRFDKKLVSRLKLQQAQQNVKIAASKVASVEAQLQSAVSDLAARQTEAKAKELRARVDVDKAAVQVNSAKGDAAKAAKELAAAQLELTEARKAGQDLQARVSRQTTLRIVAPVDGYVTRLTKAQQLKEGDLICVIVTEAPRTSPRKPVDESATAKPGRASIAASGMAGWRIAETIGAASSLGRRYREIRSLLRVAEANRAAATVAKLKRDFEAVEFERETAIAILKAQREAAHKLRDSQTTLSDLVKRQVAQGSAPPTSLPPAQQALVTTKAEIRQLDLLLAYYTKLAKEGGSSPQEDQKIALALLKAQLEAAKKKLRFEAEQRKLVRRRFELGDGALSEVLKAEQAEATVAAEVRKLEALLRYYEEVGAKEASPERNGAGNGVGAGALPVSCGRKYRSSSI